jgi:hypothetical protein
LRSILNNKTTSDFVKSIYRLTFSHYFLRLIKNTKKGHAAKNITVEMIINTDDLKKVISKVKNEYGFY